MAEFAAEAPAALGWDAAEDFEADFERAALELASDPQYPLWLELVEAQSNGNV